MPALRSESCHYSGAAPPLARSRADQGRRTTARDGRPARALTLWMHPVLAGVVDHALDIDNIFLIARIEQKLGPTARTRQIDIDDVLDPAGRTRHHHDLVRQKH